MRLPLGTLHLDSGHRPVRDAMPLMVSPERTATRVVLACAACCGATVAVPARRWLTIAMTDIAEREAAAEMLLEAKGFSDVVVSITEDNCDVVLNMGEVTDAKRAQVEDIVKRKTNIAADKIVITPIVVDESGE